MRGADGPSPPQATSSRPTQMEATRGRRDVECTSYSFGGVSVGGQCTVLVNAELVHTYLFRPKRPPLDPETRRRICDDPSELLPKKTTERVARAECVFSITTSLSGLLRTRPMMSFSYQGCCCLACCRNCFSIDRHDTHVAELKNDRAVPLGARTHGGGAMASKKTPSHSGFRRLRVEIDERVLWRGLHHTCAAAAPLHSVDALHVRLGGSTR